MNRTVNELKLFGHLALTPSNLIGVVFGLINTSIAAAIPAGWQRWFFIFVVVVSLLTCSPDFRDYQALNLSRRYWARHKQRLVAGLGLVMLVIIGVVAAVSSAGIDWVLAACVLAVLVYRLAWLPQPIKPLSGKQAVGAAQEDPGAGQVLPMTPVNQLIRVPQGKTFLGIWLVTAIVVIAIDVLGGLAMGDDPGRAIAMTVITALFTMSSVMKVVGESLRDWVHFGGSRLRWARETALTGLAGPTVVTLVGGAYIWLAGYERAATTVTILLVTALVAPVLAVLLELADRKGTWFVPVGYLVIAAIVLLFGSDWNLGRLEMIGVALAQYLGFALILPVVVRRHVMFGPGVRGWFGLRTGAATV